MATDRESNGLNTKSEELKALEDKAIDFNIPEVEDYLAHTIAKKARAYVYGYFAIVGALASVIFFFYGNDVLNNVIETNFVKVIKKKQEEAANKVESMSKEFQGKIKRLQESAEAKSIEFHELIGFQLGAVSTQPNPYYNTRVDLSNMIGPMGDQGVEGTTIGFSLAYALSAEVKRVFGNSLVFSARSIYVEAKKRDMWPGEDYEGTSVEGGIAALEHVGAYLETDWPYESKNEALPNRKPAMRISSYEKLNDVNQIIASLVDRRPIVVTCMILRGFADVGSNGIVSLEQNQMPLGSSSLCIVGYDGTKDMFRFANTWGSNWGDSGFGYIGREDLSEILKGAFRIAPASPN